MQPKKNLLLHPGTLPSTEWRPKAQGCVAKLAGTPDSDLWMRENSAMHMSGLQTEDRLEAIAGWPSFVSVFVSSEPHENMGAQA